MESLVSAFGLGLIYGLGPCTFSCAPILMPIVMSTSKNYMQGLWYTLVFSFGRVLVYTFLGALMGFLGKILNISLPSWTMGVFMIILGVALFFKLHTKCLVPKIKIKGIHMSFLAGIIMGFSPCAPLLAALGLAISSKSAILGGLITLIFGIGTTLSPLLILGMVSGKWASLREFQKINNYVAGVFVILIGIMYFFQ